MKKINIIILVLFLPIFYSCSGISDVGKIMRNEKLSSTDEFLVKKRAPLVLPPDYENIPQPGVQKNTVGSNEEKIDKIFKITEEESSSNNNIKSVEQSIINKIGK